MELKKSMDELTKKLNLLEKEASGVSNNKTVFIIIDLLLERF